MFRESAARFVSAVRSDKGIALAAAWSFNQLAYAIVYPFIPIYLCQERGLPYATASVIFPLLGLATVLAPVPCGWLTDRFGYTRMMLAGQFFRGIIFFLLAYMVYAAAPFWLLATALMLNTAVGTAFQVSSDSYLVYNTLPGDRPLYYSKIRIGFNVGWAIGPMLGAFFAKTPYWAFFIGTGLLCMLGTYYTYAACCRNAVKPVAVRREKQQQSRSGVLRDIFCNRSFLFLTAGTLLLTLLSSQLYSTMSIFATATVQISRNALGSIYSLNGFMVLLLQLPVTALLKRSRLPLHFQLAGGALLYVSGYLLLGMAGGAFSMALAVAVVTFGELTVQPGLSAAVTREVTPENSGKMMSVFSLMRGIGSSAGPWLGGQLYAVCVPALLWTILSSFAVGASLLFALSGKKCGQRQTP